MSKWLNAAVLVASVAIASVAFAEAPAFDDIDANKDGKLSKAEASAVKGLDFAKADRDQNGTLDRVEYEAAIG
jgi:hypothetical protein